MSEIVQKGAVVLKTRTRPVLHFSSQALNTLILEMADALFKQADGIGIAAPQIGKSAQVFLVTSDVLNLNKLNARIKTRTEKKTAVAFSEDDYMVFINPAILKQSRKQVSDMEGCLSVRGIYGNVVRPEKVTIEYFDEHGKKNTRGASGLFARVLQHEIDHLNGILFVDKAKNVRKLT